MTVSSVSSVGGATGSNVSTSVSYQSQTQAGGQIKIAIRRVYKDALSCAHHLPNHNGKCKNQHGHNYTIEVELTGNIHAVLPGSSISGMVEDFSTIDKHFEFLIKTYDHTNLNDTLNEYPTAERLAFQILCTLRAQDPRYSEVVVWETNDSCATARVL